MTTAPDRIALMQTFVRIVEAGSLSAAAAQLGTTQPTISRRLQALEQSLGLRLLQRSTHTMKLTEDGQRCFERARELLASWNAFESDLRGATEAPQGTLRVVAPHAFGQEHLVHLVADYLRRHEQVTLEWLLHDGLPDFIAGGIDCAIHVGAVEDPALVAVKVAEVPRIVVAAPSLAGTTPLPRDPQALAGLPWLALRTYYRTEVELSGPGGERRTFAIRPRMGTDSVYALRSAAVLGLGVAIVSAWVVADDLAQGRLLHLAPDWQAPPLPMHVLYPYAHFYPARLRRFIEVLRTGLPASLRGDAVTPAEFRHHAP